MFINKAHVSLYNLKIFILQVMVDIITKKRNCDQIIRNIIELETTYEQEWKHKTPRPFTNVMAIFLMGDTIYRNNVSQN